MSEKHYPCVIRAAVTFSETTDNAETAHIAYRWLYRIEKLPFVPFFGLDLCFDAEWPEDTWTVREVIYVVRDSYFLVYAVDDELDFEHDGAHTSRDPGHHVVFCRRWLDD